MRLYLIDHNYRYAAEQVLLSLFPGQRPEYPEGAPSGDRAELRLSRGKTLATARCVLVLDGKRSYGRAAVRESEITGKLLEDRLLQRIVKLAFYRAATRHLGQRPVWGALTGIRPGKLMSGYLEAGMSETAALRRFMAEYDVSRERALLCLDTARVSIETRESLAPLDVCLYVGIPFCPTRCAYCSFVSQSVAKSMKLIPDFLEALWLEMAETARIIKKLGLRPVSVYVGGGTPTTLSPEQLGALLALLAEYFDLSHLREYTVEAGRPDTITTEKLAVLKAYAVDRISINPQSMDDRVLTAIGRRHTALQVEEAMAMARDVGGFAVNMDLIAGLPEDSPEGFNSTLEKVLKMAPENITIHTLSRKNGSAITLENTSLPTARQVEQMLTQAEKTLRNQGFSPYYLYRQKFMSGGFENVGWSKKGYANLYNICIMEELRSIIAMGGGASTKLVSPAGRILRIFTPKYPREYIDSTEKILSDKPKIEEFYHGLSSHGHQCSGD